MGGHAHGDGVTVLKGRCLPYGEAITYWPLAEILKSYTGVLDSDPPDVALAKIAALADDVLAGVPDPARSAAVLAFTFGLEDPRFGLADAAAAPGATRDPRGVAGVLHRSDGGSPGDRRGRGHPLGGRPAARPARGARGQGGRPVALRLPGAARPRAAPDGVGRRKAQLQLDLPRAALARRRGDARRGAPRRRGAARRDAGGDARACRREPALPRGDHPAAHRRGADRPRRRAGGERPRTSTRS